MRRRVAFLITRGIFAVIASALTSIAPTSAQASNDFFTVQAKHIIAEAVAEFDTVFSQRGVVGVKSTIQTCYAGAIAAHNVTDGILHCVAFDATAHSIISAIEKLQGWPQTPDFNTDAFSSRVHESLTATIGGDQDFQTRYATAVVREVEADLPAAKPKGPATATTSGNQAVTSYATETERKGVEYAAKTETTWKLTTEKNEMTDAVELIASSDQSNGHGAAAKVTGMCVDGLMTFTALVTDEDGDPTIPLAGGSRNIVPGLRRVNDDRSEDHNFPMKDFQNQFILGILASSAKFKAKSEAFSKAGFIQKYITINTQWINADTSWRVLAQIETSSQSLLLKIPLFDSNVEKLAASCK
jgi:hypothetical protein